MIDSHCHLDFPKLKDNFNTIIQNSKNNNLSTILTINTDPNKFEDHLSLIKDYNNIYISYGMHPDYVNEKTFFNPDKILLSCKHQKVIGIGETGLDFFRSIKFKKKQIEIFENPIISSIKSNLPLIIHQRNSENEIIDVLNNFRRKNNLSLVFHCFSGSKKLLKFCIDNNYYISLSGIITFKNANDLRETIKSLPLNLLLLETDSPFLAPIPMRGKTNEPSFIKYTFEYVSNFFNIPLKELIKLTDNNFYKLFSKAKRDNIFNAH